MTYRRELTVVLGIFSIVLGLVFVGLVPLLQRDVRVHAVPAVGLAAAPFLGFLFGLGWTPCIGPTLGAIVTLSLNEGDRRPRRAAVGDLRHRAGPAVHPGRPGLRADARHGAVRPPPPGLGDPVRRGDDDRVGVLLVTGWWDQAVTWAQVRLVEFNEVPV